MRTRLLSFVGIWLVVGLIVAFSVQGHTAAFAVGILLLVAVSAAAHREFCVILGKSGGKPNTALSVALGVLAILAITLSAWGVLQPDAAAQFAGNELRVAFPGVAIGALALVLLLAAPTRLTDLGVRVPTMFSWLLVPVCIMPLPVLAASLWAKGGNPSGLLLVIWIIATVKFTDCGGLLIGCAFGKHKLAPSISPKKSWEGCAGGIAASVLVSVGLAWVFGHYASALHWSLADKLTPGTAALLALPLAVLSIPSDLIESAFKRRADVKDSGATIPGIGGAFDLLDSLLLPAPVAYLLLHYYVL